MLAAIAGADADGEALLADAGPDPVLARAIQRWPARLTQMPGSGRLAAWQDSGLRLIAPGDAEWPWQFDDLGGARPLLLWARGGPALPFPE